MSVVATVQQGNKFRIFPYVLKFLGDMPVTVP